MLGLFNAFAPTQIFSGNAAPIGIDLGMEQIRMAQVAPGRESPQLIAAAASDVPSYLAADPVAYSGSLTRTVKDLSKAGRFQGRKVILGLPSSLVHLLHLRIGKMDAEGTKAALPGEVAGKIPFDPISAMLRHHTVGDVYTNDGARQEVICTAARRDMVELLLGAVERARLEVVGLVATPVAIRDCFSHIFDRQGDRDTTYCFVDIGRASTRVVVAAHNHLYFARSIAIGCDHLDQAIADMLGVDRTEAKLLRHQLNEQAPAEGGSERAEAAQPASGARAEAYATQAVGATAVVAAPPDAEAHTESRGGRYEEDLRLVRPVGESRTSIATDLAVMTAMGSVVQQLSEEVQRCRRYHEATFPEVLIDKLIFTGGGAVQRKVCQAVAQRLHIAAKIGDPIGRLTTEVDHQRLDFVTAGIDRRRSQPGWVVACGLSLGGI